MNSLEQVNQLVNGNDQGQNAGDMFRRLKAGHQVIDQAYEVRCFFHRGWYRLKDTSNQKVNARETEAFAELMTIERYQSLVS